MQGDVERAKNLYAAGDRAGALAAAEAVAARFAFDAGGASDLEETLRESSAPTIGDRVKALSARLVTTIDAGKPAAEVAAIADELHPSLNRLVLVAQGKAPAAKERSLRTEKAVDAALADVLAMVHDAARLAALGRTPAAVEAARDAFFEFEVNGLGPDTSTVDDPLENRVENLLVNFDRATEETNPGLAQLIERRAPAADVAAKVAEIELGLGEIAELLKATLPKGGTGDANGDGRVTIVDALFTAQAALGIRAETADMDANRDGRVTIVDALFIAQAALGIRSL